MFTQTIKFYSVFAYLRVQMFEKADSRKTENLRMFRLHEKCPNMMSFLVRKRENADQKKLRIWALFKQSPFSKFYGKI